MESTGVRGQQKSDTFYLRPTIKIIARATPSSIRHPDPCMAVFCRASAILPSRKPVVGRGNRLLNQELLSPTPQKQ
ncbi:60S ribosomal protein L28 [Cricetulus griseus]|uniref:60S ribosomal protein L28 n=1 Tax=Cricetulus griseus TaxID=10029 RepID=G3I5X6_CRIGR|nr:60S ribosomal protein L28 [Cricetulus griseus]